MAAERKDVAPILVIGSSGQVATELKRRSAASPFEMVFAGRDRVDLADGQAVARLVAATRPTMVLNAAAYTKVDDAEGDAEAAFAVNAEGPGALARACYAAGAALVHLSTDYVFDGSKRSPYHEDDPICPVGVYACSKAAGERLVRQECPRHVIIRTAWVFSDTGQNFVKTMIRLGGERPMVRVVADQHGGPTWAGDIADALLEVVDRASAGHDAWGTYHFCGAPAVNWFTFAGAIFDAAARHGRTPPEVQPIPSRDYPLPTPRPANSVLACDRFAADWGVPQPDWRPALDGVVASLLGA